MQDYSPAMGYNPCMEGRKRDAKKWTPDRKEALVTTSVVTLSFIIFLVLLIMMGSIIVSSESLRLENAVERAFSEVVVALQQGEKTFPDTMSDKNVLGFGYYTPTGIPIFIWGDAYRVLPFSGFSDSSDLSDTLVSFNRDTGVIECLRYAQSISLDPENIFRRSGRGAIEFPDIIYLSFDASGFVERITVMRTVAFFSVAAVIIIYFITMHIIRQNRKFREALRRQESLVRLGEAARTLTHEIKNPLSAITIQLAILKREVRPEVLPDVMVIDHEASRLRQLTDKVSDYLRNPVGQAVELDLAEAVRDIVPVFRGKVRLMEPAPSAVVRFDRDKLRSVVENLMKNAVESCDGMEVDVEAEIINGRDGFAHLYIRDRGCGIKKEDMERIFDPFFTTKIHGSGVGLAICQRFLSAAGGTLRLYPRDGGGTTAEAVIPETRSIL